MNENAMGCWVDPQKVCPKFENGPHGVMVSAPVLVRAGGSYDVAQFVAFKGQDPIWMGVKSNYSMGYVTKWAAINEDDNDE